MLEQDYDSSVSSNFPTGIKLTSLRHLRHDDDVTWDVPLLGKSYLNVQALVDTGADTSVLNPIVLNRLGNNYKVLS